MPNLHLPHSALAVRYFSVTSTGPFARVGELPRSEPRGSWQDKPGGCEKDKKSRTKTSTKGYRCLFSLYVHSDLVEKNLVHPGSSSEGTAEVRAGSQRWDWPGADVSLGFSEHIFLCRVCWPAGLCSLSGTKCSIRRKHTHQS